VSRGVTLAALENLAQREIRHRPENRLSVIRHYHSVIEQIVLAVKMSERVRDHGGNLGSAQKTFTHSLIEIPFDLAVEVAMDRLRRVFWTSWLEAGAVFRRGPAQIATGLPLAVNRQDEM